MKIIAPVLLIAASFVLVAQTSAISAQYPAKLSPAEQSIARAKEQIAKKPGYFAGYNALAMAEARRARETSDVHFYAEAENALAKSFQLKPDNFEGLKVKTWLLLGRHEFAQALEVAKKLNQQTPDDVIVYGYLTDANVELGHYDAAENAAQWMLNLRAGNIPGLTRGAYLRELFGDLDGAVEFMRLAYEATETMESEDRAWILTQIAHLYLQSGNLAKAELHAKGALSIFPEYHYALGMLAQIRMVQRQYSEAAELFAKRYAKAPHAENLYVWAQALKLAGDHAEASARFKEFEAKSLAESKLADNSNHELVLYYSDEKNSPADALRIAKLEFARRQDVHTLDCLAWALHRNHDDSGAAMQIEHALAVGVKDPQILYHAGVIEKSLNRRELAVKYLRDAAGRYSAQASEEVAKLDTALTASTR
jgi:tetratricopeptide (TPR) repeat protein